MSSLWRNNGVRFLCRLVTYLRQGTAWHYLLRLNSKRHPGPPGRSRPSGPSAPACRHSPPWTTCSPWALGIEWHQKNWHLIFNNTLKSELQFIRLTALHFLGIKYLLLLQTLKNTIGSNIVNAASQFNTWNLSEINTGSLAGFLFTPSPLSAGAADRPTSAFSSSWLLGEGHYLKEGNIPAAAWGD